LTLIAALALSTRLPRAGSTGRGIQCLNGGKGSTGRGIVGFCSRASARKRCFSCRLASEACSRARTFRSCALLIASCSIACSQQQKVRRRQNVLYERGTTMIDPHSHPVTCQAASKEAHFPDLATNPIYSPAAANEAVGAQATRTFLVSSQIFILSPHTSTSSGSDQGFQPEDRAINKCLISRPKRPRVQLIVRPHSNTHLVGQRLCHPAPPSLQGVVTFPAPKFGARSKKEFKKESVSLAVCCALALSCCHCQGLWQRRQRGPHWA